jgi:hypothetical protein
MLAGKELRMLSHVLAAGGSGQGGFPVRLVVIVLVVVVVIAVVRLFRRHRRGGPPRNGG